jgi:type IV secretion system protein VirB1
MIDLALIMACAPNVAPSTIQEIIRVESAGNPLAVNINTRNGVKLRPTIKITTAQHAIAVTYAAMALGHTVDMGYMQVNSANLAKLGHTVEDMFDSCMNLKAGAAILSAAYAMALPLHKNEQVALQAALSAYNTGSFQRGFDNGYVAKYTGYVPAIRRKSSVYAAETTVFSRKPNPLLAPRIDWNRQR